MHFEWRIVICVKLERTYVLEQNLIDMIVIVENEKSRDCSSNCSDYTEDNPNCIEENGEDVFVE